MIQDGMYVYNVHVQKQNKKEKQNYICLTSLKYKRVIKQKKNEVTKKIKKKTFN